MKKKVVQLVSFKSTYNENLQMNLRNNKEFSSRFDLIELNIEELMDEFERVKGFKKYKNIYYINKLIYLYCFNKYLISKYKSLNGSILHIQYVATKYAFLVWFFKSVFDKVIITFWGSDLLRVGHRGNKFLRLISCFSDVITFETYSFLREFNRRISRKFNSKIRIVDFGIQILDDIDSVSYYDIKSFKQKYGISFERELVAIGYSKIIEHQHISVINSLINSNINKDEIFIVFPWTYGVEVNGYRKQIEDLIKDKFDYVFIENRLTNKEMAVLRSVTDILVHVETTDVLSFSMLETLYAKNMVITGNWLPYDDIYKEGIFMEQVNSVDEVGNKIKNLLYNNIDEAVLDRNKEIVGNLYKWDKCIKNWIDLYK